MRATLALGIRDSASLAISSVTMPPRPSARSPASAMMSRVGQAIRGHVSRQGEGAHCRQSIIAGLTANLASAHGSHSASSQSGFLSLP